MRTINKRISIIDQIEVVVRDKNGKIKSKHILHNSLWYRILVKLGLKHNCMTYASFGVASGLLIDVNSQVAFGYIGIGTGTTGEQPEDDATYTHALQTEKKRKAGSKSRVTTNGSAPYDTAQLVATFSNALDGLTGIDNITEIGVMNNATAGSGVLGLRQVYTPADVCNWSQNDTMQVTVKIQSKQG